MDMTIKDAMERTGLTVHAVRHYCDSGLVPNLNHDENGNRLFDDESIRWLRMAQFLRSCGMSVAEVRRYFELCLEGETSLPERYRILEDLQRKAACDVRASQERCAYITERVQHCANILAGSVAIDDSNPLNWQDSKECPRPTN